MSLVPVRPRRPLRWPSCIEAIRAVVDVDASQDVYIVGGAVRDAYQHHPLHDIDLATPHDGCTLARHIANQLKGAYYPLDRKRGVGRTLIPWDNTQLTVDVAQFRGPDLLTDLRKRDFTLNAMAVQLTGDLQAVIDPLGGLGDLEKKHLRQCGPDSINNDPVRILRAVRASVSLGLLIEPTTRQSLKTNVEGLATTSVERVRDELFQILDGECPSAALAALHQIGVFKHIVPELATLQDIEQGLPHQFNVWQHTIMTVEHLATILQIIAPQRQVEVATNLQSGMIAFTLDEFRSQLQDHLAQTWPNKRTHRALLLLATLLHDIGKPATRTLESDGRIRFLRHEQIGEKLATSRSAAFHLSNDETEHIATIIRHHMRPHWLYNNKLTARSIYRFWRDTGPAGVDICLLALADYLGTYGTTLDSKMWIAYVEIIQTLLRQYYLHHETAVAPPRLITGQDLLDQFQLKPGPQIGALLEDIREAQIEGDIVTTQEALDWVHRFLEQQ